MTFYAFAWVASFTYGLYAVVAKLIGKYQLKNTWQFSFFSTFFAGLITSMISLVYGATLPKNWMFVILAALFLALGGFLYLYSLKLLDVSVMAPLFNIRVVITVLFGYLFLGETLTPAGFWLILMVVVAGFFATMDEEFSIKSFFSKNVGFGMLFMLVLSIQSTLINRAVDQNDYWTAMLWIGLLAIPFGFLMLYPKFKNDLKKSKPKDYLGVGVLSVVGGLGDLAAFKAFSGNVGVSSVIISLPLSMVLAFLLSVFKPELLEKHPLKVYLVRFLAAFVMIWGALQLSG